MDDPKDRILFNLARRKGEQNKHASNAHEQFLHMRQTSLEQIEALIVMQIRSVSTIPQPSHQPKTRQTVFTTDQMREFATGSMARCFGVEFARYENRRHPRIPNGDLMLMSRAVEINGERQRFNQPASIVTEYDVPTDAWFILDNSSPTIPYAVWMEMALQPCGFLSAYLGTMLLSPNTDFFFRNLDGNATLYSEMDLRGKTVTCSADLVSTLTSGDTVIQRFNFKLSCGNDRLFEGWSIFGFFTPEAMANQTGLDGGKKTYPSQELSPTGTRIKLEEFSNPMPGKPNLCLPRGRMRFIDHATHSMVVESESEIARLYAKRRNDPSAWFYARHFHGDPVMPGSLGVEAILQTLQAYAIDAGLAQGMNSPMFHLPTNQSLSWKYRGQILPTHREMKLEVKVKKVEITKSNILIAGDASLWADDIRIYEVKDAAVCLTEQG